VLLHLILIAGAIFGCAIFCAYLIHGNISRALGRLKVTMEVLAGGELAVEIPEVDRNDEIGDMAKVMRIFKDNAAAARMFEAERAKRREREVAVQHADRVDALGRLASGIAHDLNNALVPVLAMTKSVIVRYPKESREYTSLELALMGAQRARELVPQILAFGRKEAIEYREFDLTQAVSDGIKLLRASLPSTIRLVTTIEPVPAFHGDRGQLYQVLINLVTNAAQAIGDRPGSITVALHADLAEGVQLTVTDSGSGMDEQTIARMFEPFFTTKARGKGTGLGLSVVHEIVKSHGGTITVHSTPGEGTRIDVVFARSSESLAALPMGPREPAVVAAS
jgi:two-component system cell cycle sensor histidine kinase/response regulator CckA